VANVRVSSSTTLRELKMMLFEQIGVHPRNARLYFQGRAIEADNDMSMARVREGCRQHVGEGMGGWLSVETGAPIRYIDRYTWA
jgi:hypothetical protein